MTFLLIDTELVTWVLLWRRNSSKHSQELKCACMLIQGFERVHRLQTLAMFLEPVQKQGKSKTRFSECRRYGTSLDGHWPSWTDFHQWLFLLVSDSGLGFQSWEFFFRLQVWSFAKLGIIIIRFDHSSISVLFHVAHFLSMSPVCVWQHISSDMISKFIKHVHKRILTA